MNDLLRPLLDAIEAVRTRVSNHRTYLEGHETRTRVSLVDPILHALGWDPSDPDSVALEWKIERKAADYALLSGDHKPVAIVEAKTLGTSLGGMDQLGQVGMYGIGGSADLIVLTDGNQWHLYDLKRVQSAGGLVVKVGLSTDPPETVAVQLLELWQPIASSRYRRDVQTAPVRRKSTNDSKPLAAPRDDGWVPLLKFKGKKNAKPLSPARLPNGAELPIKHWKDLLTGVARWLIDGGDLTPSQLPLLQPNSKNCLVNTEPRHQSGKMMTEAVDLGSGIWLETFADQQTTRNYTAHLLRHCGKDPGDLYLRRDR